MEKKKVGLIKNLITSLVIGYNMINFGCGSKGNPVNQGTDPITGNPPTLQSIVINEGAEYATDRIVKVKANFENAHSGLVAGDVTYPTGYNDFNPDSTLDVTLTAGEGLKIVKLVVQNEYGVSDTARDSIFFDNTPPKGLDSLVNVVTNDNIHYFNLNLSDVDTGSFEATDANGNVVSGDIRELDSLKYTEGTTNIKIDVKDKYGNSEPYDISVTATKVTSEEKGLESALAKLASRGYTPRSDSTRLVGIPDKDGKIVYVLFDRILAKGTQGFLYTMFDGANALDAATLAAMNRYDSLMASRNAPRRTLYLPSDFENVTNARIDSLIDAYEASLPSAKLQGRLKVQDDVGHAYNQQKAHKRDNNVICMDKYRRDQRAAIRQQKKIIPYNKAA